jgi:hypothetical protein
MRVNVPVAGGQVLLGLTRAVCGRTAHPGRPVIMNIHAAPGSVWHASVDELDQQLRAQIAAVMGASSGLLAGCLARTRMVYLGSFSDT